jgi:hypothetical protein
MATGQTHKLRSTFLYQFSLKYGGPVILHCIWE